MSLLLICFLTVVPLLLISVLVRWYICYFVVVSWIRNALKAEVKIKSAGTWPLTEVREIRIQFHPHHTLEIDRIWISSKLLNRDLQRYLVFCVGKARVRFDAQVPLRPFAKKSKSGGKVPKALLFLSRLLSVHVDSIDVTLLNLTPSEYLWHAVVKGTTLSLEPKSNRLVWDLSTQRLNSEVLKGNGSGTCLAEVCLSLQLSGDVGLPELKPGCLSLSVKRLTAALHEDLFGEVLQLPPPSSKSMHDPSVDDESVQFRGVEWWRRLHPQKVDVEFEDTNLTLSIHSQERCVHWMLKSLMLAYGRESEHHLFHSAASSLEFLIENELLLSRHTIFCLDSIRTDLQVNSTDTSGSITINACSINYRHQDFSGWFNLLPWEDVIRRPAVARQSRFPRLQSPMTIRTSVSDVSISVELEDTTPFTLGFVSAGGELQHLLGDIKVKDVSMDHFCWRVCGQGSHILKAPHPPGKHVWGEALILDSLRLPQGSFNRPHVESGSNIAPSLNIQLALMGFQVELSEMYVLCLSRLFSPFKPSSDKTPERLVSAPALPFCSLKLNCSLDDVNVFTMCSNLAGAVSLRLDAIKVRCTGENSKVSLQGVSLSLLKALAESMETCYPASQSPRPVLQLTAIAFDHNINSRTLEIQCEEEDLSVEWTPSDHVFLVTEARSWWNMLRATKEAGDSPVKPAKASETSSVLQDLCVCVYLGRTHLRAHVSELNYIFLHTQALSLLANASSTSMHSSHLYLNFDGNDIFSFKELDVNTHREPPADFRKHRDPFPFLTTQQNRVWVFTCPSLAVDFPYKYNFSDTFDKAVSVQKWLKSMHSSSPDPSTIIHECLPPDLIFRVGQFSFIFQDNAFETKLHDNYELMKDENAEIPKRRKLPDKEVCKQHGQLPPKSATKDVYTLLDKEKIEVYIKRSRLLHASMPPRKSLLDWKMSELELVVLADRSFHGPENVRQQLRDIDGTSPFPSEGLPLAVYWCRVINFKLGTFIVAIRDYPRHLFVSRDWELSGRLAGAQQDGHQQAYYKDVLSLGLPGGDVTVDRNLLPLKFYHDFKSNASLCTIVWGPCWHPAFALVCQVFQMLSKTSIESSPPLAWWDKLRFRLHGRWVMDSDRFNFHQLATKDPYNTTENIHWECKKFKFAWNPEKEPGRFTFKGHLDVNLRTPSKYDDICVLRLPNLQVTIKLEWLCQGNANPHDHHAVTLCCAENATCMTSGNRHDSYRAFCSENLNLDISMDLNQQCDPEPHQPRVLLYSSTLQWLQNFYATWTSASWPICRGKLFHNFAPTGKRLNRHYKQLSFKAAFPQLQVCYQDSPSQQNGVQVQCKEGNIFSTGVQTLVPPASALIRRPIKEWKWTRIVSTLSELTVHLVAPTTSDEMPDVRTNVQMNRSHLLSLSSLSYQRPTPDYVHTLCLMDLRASWTTTNRNIAFGLFDNYRNVARLKRNLSTEALNRLWIETQLRGKKLKSSRGLEGAPTTAPVSPTHEDQTDKLVVSSSENSGVSDQRGCSTTTAPQTNDICKRNWLVDLVNCQVMLRGTETAGCVLTSAANARLCHCEHRPAWYGNTLKQKTEWTCELKDMQYFATMERDHSSKHHEERQMWLYVKDIEKHRDQNPDSVLERIGRGQAVRGIVNTTADKQVQRIISRCNCSMAFVAYSHEIDPELATQVKPPELLNKHEEADKQAGVEDTVTVTHEDKLEISTNPFQYAMILDIFSNLLLLVSPKRKEHSEKEQDFRLQLNMSNNHEEQRGSILHLQEEVRQHIAQIRSLEKHIYSGVRPQSEEDPVGNDATLHSQLDEEKNDMQKKSEQLNIRIRCFKDFQLQLAHKLELPKTAEDISVVRRTEINLDQAHWCFTEDDAQLMIAELELKSFMYRRMNKSDDKAEHLVEVGWFAVNNMLPNPNSKDNDVVILRPQSSGLSGVDKFALRIFSKVCPPVGISVNEHFEVNISPLTIKISYKFYTKMMGFFFPGKNVEEDGDEESRKRAEPPANDSDRMTEQAAKNKTFDYIKIPKVSLCLSYPGLNDFNLVLPGLEYRYKTWTWLDFAKAVKKDSQNNFYREVLIQKIPARLLPGWYTNGNASEREENRKVTRILGVKPNQSVSGKRRKITKK